MRSNWRVKLAGKLPRPRRGTEAKVARPRAEPRGRLPRKQQAPGGPGPRPGARPPGRFPRPRQAPGGKSPRPRVRLLKAHPRKQQGLQAWGHPRNWRASPAKPATPGPPPRWTGAARPLQAPRRSGPGPTLRKNGRRLRPRQPGLRSGCKRPSLDLPLPTGCAGLPVRPGLPRRPPACRTERPPPPPHGFAVRPGDPFQRARAPSAWVREPPEVRSGGCDPGSCGRGHREAQRFFLRQASNPKSSRVLSWVPEGMAGP